MAVEKFFAPKHDQGKHPSMHCHRTRFEAAVEKQKPELCYPGEIGGHFQDDNREATMPEVLWPVERGETPLFVDEKSTT